MPGHGFLIVSYQQPPGTGRESQDFLIFAACETGSISALKVYGWLTPNGRQQDKLVEIGIRLKADFHGCSDDRCRWASASFW